MLPTSPTGLVVFFLSQFEFFSGFLQSYSLSSLTNCAAAAGEGSRVSFPAFAALLEAADAFVCALCHRAVLLLHCHCIPGTSLGHPWNNPGTSLGPAPAHPGCTENPPAPSAASEPAPSLPQGFLPTDLRLKAPTEKTVSGQEGDGRTSACPDSHKKQNRDSLLFYLAVFTWIWERHRETKLVFKHSLHYQVIRPRQVQWQHQGWRAQHSALAGLC